MKVGVWLKENYDPVIGGGHSYYQKLIKRLDDFQFSEGVDVCFISRVGIKQEGFKKPVYCIPSPKTPLKMKIANKFLSYKLYNRDRYQRKYSKPYEVYCNKYAVDFLKGKEIDLLYYTIQHQYEIQNFPFIATNWDIGYLTTFPFPEINQDGIFEARDRYNRNILRKAFSIFVESEKGKQELIQFLRISSDRIKVIYTFPGEVVCEKVPSNVQSGFLSNYGLKQFSYFFYPAQFWPHKNHSGLLRAFNKIKDARPDLKLVLTGSDKGNLNYIKDLVHLFQMDDYIVFPGFVKNDVLYTFYKNSIALVMPSFLGPTNLPLLEAREIGCPVLCSNLAGHIEQLGEGALYFDPANYEEMADCLSQILVSGERKILLANAEQEKTRSQFNIENSIHLIDRHLSELINLKGCWE